MKLSRNILSFTSSHHLSSLLSTRSSQQTKYLSFNANRRSFGVLYEVQRSSEYENSHLDDFLQNYFNATEKNIEIRKSVALGRALYAAKDFKEDEHIFEEWPLAAIPKKRGEYCGQCLKNIGPHVLKLPSGNLILDERNQAPPAIKQHPLIKRMNKEAKECPSCTKEKYCGDDCRDIAFMEHHRHLCTGAGGFTAVPYLHVEAIMDRGDPFPLLITRIYARLLSEMQQNIITIDENTKEVSGGSWDFLKRLESRTIDEYDEGAMMQEFELIKSNFANDDQNVLQPLLNYEQYIHMKGLCALNTIQSYVQMEVLNLTYKPESPIEAKSEFFHHGVFLPHLGALINHSCEPNLISKSNYNCKTEWVAKRDIAKGEQLTMTYVPLELGITERRSRLQNWNFVCHCPRCDREDK